MLSKWVSFHIVTVWDSVIIECHEREPKFECLARLRAELQTLVFVVYQKDSEHECIYGYFGKFYGTLASGIVITFCSNKMGHFHSGVLL